MIHQYENTEKYFAPVCLFTYYKPFYTFVAESGKLIGRHCRTGDFLVTDLKRDNMKDNRRICPVERAGGLDNPVRKIFQNPRKILKSYINEGMTVLDLGCGPGFFTSEIAIMLKNSGKVIAADLQQGMLDRLKKKIKGTDREKRIQLHKCEEGRIGLSENVDFILGFYMVHEVPDQYVLFRELKSILNPGGKILIIEPDFHVSKKSFEEMIRKAGEIGFEVSEGPVVFFSRSVLLISRNQ
jgi:SAM-dependent methyltransferase